MIEIIDIKKQEIGGGYAPLLAAITSDNYTIAAGQTSVTIPALINSTIILLQREIVPYSQGVVPADRVYSFDTATGLITFDFSNPTNAENIYILFFPTPSSGQEIASEPVSLGEAKTHLRVTFPDDDVEIWRLITAARQAVENYCNISIALKRITLIADCVDCWTLPYGPVIAIESVENRTGRWAYGSMGSDTYHTDGDQFEGGPGRLRILYTTGMESCPEDLKQAILNQVAFLYENRGKTSDSGVCDQAQQLANPYRISIWI